MQHADELTNRMTEALKNPANKQEGSFARDNIQAVAEEGAMLYEYADFVNDMHFLDTTKGKYLDRKAEDYNLKRKQATKAKGVCSFYGTNGTIIQRGFEVSSDTRIYRTLEEAVITKESVSVLIEAEKAGEIGNVPERSVWRLVSALPGVDRVENVTAIKNGSDIETDEAFRERLYAKVRTPATSGNVHHYYNWAMSVEGVGRCKVFPLWNGNGTVKVSILDSTMGKADELLIEKVKKYIDPDPGRGEGQAPIGATLTVSTATHKEITLDLAVTSEADKEEIKRKITTVVQEFFKKIAYTKRNVLSFALISNLLFDIEEIQDIQDLKINEMTDRIQIGAEEIPYLKEVVVR